MRFHGARLKSKAGFAYFSYSPALLAKASEAVFFFFPRPIGCCLNIGIIWPPRVVPGFGLLGANEAQTLGNYM